MEGPKGNVAITSTIPTGFENVKSFNDLLPKHSIVFGFAVPFTKYLWQRAWMRYCNLPGLFQRIFFIIIYIYIYI